MEPFPLRDISTGKMAYPELFATHIWDGKEYSMNKGMRNLLSKWKKTHIPTYKCIYSNSQFHVAAAILRGIASKRLHRAVYVVELYSQG